MLLQDCILGGGYEEDILTIPNIVCDTPRRNRLLNRPVLLLTLLAGTPASCADYQKGLTAFESGDYATALRA